MKKNLRKLVAVGLLVLVIGVIVKIPARVALQLVPDSVLISGASGTIWNGRAGAVLVSGIYLRNVEWRTKPFGFLTGKLALGIRAAPASGFVESDLALGLNGAATLSDLNASIPLSVFADAINVPNLSGSTSLQFDYLTVLDGVPTSASGTVQIADMTVPMVHPGSLGGYTLEFSDFENGVIASIEDTDGVVDIAGTLTLADDRSYSLLAQLAATSTTPAELTRQIEFLPDGNAAGQHELRLEGSL
ncbi:MAG: type II secretion system protein N [Woeseiaceae bacterium]|nr:type II secretion system protein N [Woeseiaceae bacterium]